MQNGPCCANSMTTPPAMLHHVYRAHNGLHHRAAAGAATATLWRALWCVPGAGGTLQRAGVPACSAWPHSTPPVTWQRGSPRTGSRRHHRPTGAARRRVVLLHLCIRRAYVVVVRTRTGCLTFHSSIDIYISAFGRAPCVPTASLFFVLYPILKGF